MEIPREVLNAIHRVLSSIRLSLDGSARPIAKDSRFEELRQAYLRFEEVRFLFRSRIGPFGGRGTEEDIVSFQDDIRELVSDDRFMFVIDQIRYRPSMPRRDMEAYGVVHPALIEGQISVAEAMRFLLNSLERIPYQLTLEVEDPKTHADEYSADSAVSRLKRIVPKQQNVSPVRFEILERRLVIVAQPAATFEEDKANARAAQAELAAQGYNILEQLERSNCDRRLIDSFKDLQGKLGANADIVRLGLSHITCEVMCDKFQCELPDAVSAMMKAHTLGIGMYVAQFPDWQRFSEQAATAELSATDIPQISAAVDAVVEHLNLRPDLADPQVPRTLLALQAMIADPRTATKRAISAVWRSLESLVVKVYSYTTEFLDKTATKAVDAGSTVAAKGIVMALMATALAGGLVMTPIATQIPQSVWIAKASAVVRSQIEAFVP